MPNLRVNTIKSGDGNTGPIFEGNLEFSTTAHVVLPKGTTAERPVGVSTGALRYNTDTSQVEYYDGTSWIETSSYDASVRGLFGGGNTPTGVVNTIDYITIGLTSNATDFGDLTVARRELSACSSSTRGVWGGSYGGGSVTNTIDYVTIATTGNATDFGDLTFARGRLAACSNSTRGLFGGGFSPTGGSPTPYIYPNVIDYITLASVGNATDFGDLTLGRGYPGACASSTRGVFAGSYNPSNVNVIDYVTIASIGNATDFGDLSVTRGYLTGGCSNSTRGLFAGGLGSNVIDYITIATTGNATDFGDLTIARYVAACSSSTRGVFGGGNTNANGNTLDYVTIASTGNATDFGDLTQSRTNILAACSNGHGGLS